MRFWPFSRLEKKQTDADILEMLGGGVTTSAGVSVSAENALRVPAVSRAVTLISDTIASFPVLVERREGSAWKQDTEHPVAKLLEVGPNDWTSTTEFVRNMIVAALTSDDSARAWVSRAGDGRILEIIQFDGGRIGVEYDQDGSGRPVQYRLNGAPVLPDNVIHVRTPFRRCPVSRAREAIGVALTLEKHTAKTFINGARPSGQIVSPKPLGDEGVKKMIKGFMAAFGGAENSGGTPIFWDGTEFKAIAMSSVDAQFLELKKEQVVELARSFGIPPAFLFELGRSTWGNYEQQTKTFLSSLETWMHPFESALRRALFSSSERADWRISFERDDLTAVSLTERATAISSLIASRVINPNEARPWVGNGLAPYEGGEVFANPNTGASQPGATATTGGSSQLPPMGEDPNLREPEDGNGSN